MLVLLPTTARSFCFPLKRSLVENTAPLPTLSFLTVFQRAPCCRWMRSWPASGDLPQAWSVRLSMRLVTKGKRKAVRAGFGLPSRKYSPDWNPLRVTGNAVESRISKLIAALAPAFQNRYSDCSSQAACTSRGAPTGFGGLLSHQNSVTHAGWLPGSVPTLSAARSTPTTRPRSGVEASPGSGPDVSGPPPVLSIAWWAKTSNSAGPAQPSVLTRISVVFFL